MANNRECVLNSGGLCYGSARQIVPIRVSYDMRLTFLGTGGYHPNERRHTACLLLPDAGIALDAGTGFFRVQERLQTDTLDVFLTHAHLDHVCGLTFFLVPVLNGDVKTVRVHGSKATLAAVREHLFAQALFPVDPPFEWCELPQETAVPVPEDGRLTWIDLEHPGGSIGYRIDWPNRSLAYITDTTAPGNYIEFIRDVDVLIHECYFPDDMHEWALKTGHSSATAVAKIAGQSGAKRLYLVHADPQKPDDDPIGLSGIRHFFPATELAEDLQSIDF
ncbi:MAG: MBL fold metallo-hydrolase [Planctomycetaceae bacterium]